MEFLSSNVISQFVQRAHTLYWNVRRSILIFLSYYSFGIRQPLRQPHSTEPTDDDDNENEEKKIETGD